jgi:hypothetical protein
MKHHSNIDYCPFCGETEINTEMAWHPHGIVIYLKCSHCEARGGTFIEETEEAAIETATTDWNQKTLRPNTICHRLNRFFTQLEYDIRTLWGRF